MKVTLKCTLKGNQVWKKGAVFDDTVAPIPAGILSEVAKRPGITVDVEDSFSAAPQSDGSIESADLLIDFDVPRETIIEPIEEPIEEPAAPESKTGADETETKTEKPIPEYLSELERLTEIAGTIAKVLRILKISRATYHRWIRQEGVPSPKNIKVIKKALREHESSGHDNPSPAGDEKPDGSAGK